MNRRTWEYFGSLDMLPLSVYGMTETAGGVTTHTPEHLKLYTSGSAVPGVQIKIDKPDSEGIGELCMKGRSMFMGYYKNAEATREVYDSEGYLHSGDLATYKDGFLEIRGRIKELLITAGGENIAPVSIEHTFQELCPMCSNIIVIGDAKKYLSALVSLKVNMEPVTGRPSN